MKEAIKFLQENPIGCFATVDGDKPRVRPFQFMLEDGGRLYFCTGSTKDVSTQLKANSNLEFCSTSPAFAWIRVSGQAVFSDDAAIKARILTENELVKSIYQTPDNPVFELFYLAHGEVVMADFSGQPPKKFTF